MRLLTLLTLFLIAVVTSGSGSVPRSLHDRGLVTTDTLRAGHVLKTHGRVAKTAKSVVRFPGKTLGYVTPWNSRGYTLTKVFAAKFTYLAPVWLQLRSRPGAGASIQGTQDIRDAWMASVRSAGALVLPRVLAEDGPEFLADPDAVVAAIDAITSAVDRFGFDGVTLDMGGSGPMRRFKPGFIALLTGLARSTKVILVVPPAHPALAATRQRFDAADLAEIGPLVEALSLMTYDHSNPASPGPTAPIEWIHSALDSLVPPDAPDLAAKVLLGLNFYGNDFVLPQGGGPIVGSQYTDLLSRLGPSTRIPWDPIAAEHVLRFTDASKTAHLVTFPSLAYLDTRMSLALDYGIGGVAIWECGQGLDYFFDLL